MATARTPVVTIAEVGTEIEKGHSFFSRSRPQYRARLTLRLADGRGVPYTVRKERLRDMKERLATLKPGQPVVGWWYEEYEGTGAVFISSPFTPGFTWL